MAATLNLSLIWSFVVKAWSSIGPLVGVLIGAWLARSWQRKQWLLESKKAEYRELLSGLSESAHYIGNNSPNLTVQGMLTVRTGDQERGSAESLTRGFRTIEDRIFIADTVARQRIEERWVSLTKENDIHEAGIRREQVQRSVTWQFNRRSPA